MTRNSLSKRYAAENAILAQERKAHSKTSAEMAKAMDLSEGELSKIQSGARRANKDFIRKFALALGETEHYLDRHFPHLANPSDAFIVKIVQRLFENANILPAADHETLHHNRRAEASPDDSKESTIPIQKPEKRSNPLEGSNAHSFNWRV